VTDLTSAKPDADDLATRAQGVASRLAAVSDEISEAARLAGRSPQEVRLVAVSKRIDDDLVVAAYQAGQRDFAENYIQAALARMDGLAPRLANDPDVRWHMIGGLQSNKAKVAAGRFALIHGIDSLSCVRALSKRQQAIAADLAQDAPETCRVLLQIKLGGGEIRAGILPAAAPGFLEAAVAEPGVEFAGVMGIAPVGEEARPHFERLRGVVERLRTLGLPHAPLEEISAGMSGDYREAIAEGSTLVRVGTGVFGSRDGGPKQPG
jgi:pyridoxal phosphate enzyme (YggS family)